MGGASSKDKRTRRDFFAWCDSFGLDTNKKISLAFSVSVQTVRNWRQNRCGHLKPWVWLACEGYQACVSATTRDSPLPGLPRVTLAWFGQWMSRNDFHTYEEVGKALGLTRQAVHNWIRRNRFPNWLALACVGVEGRRRNPSRAEVVKSVWSLQQSEAAVGG